MKPTSKNAVCLSFILLFMGFSSINFAQSETTKKTKKTVVVTKTIDADGNEKTTRIVTEGDDMSEEELDALIEKTLKEEGIDAEVDVRVDGDGKTAVKKDGKVKEIEKEIKITIKNDGEIEESEEDGTMMFKTEDGEVIKWKGKDMKMEEMDDNTEIIIEEEIIEKDGKIEKRIKKIKRGAAPKGAFLGVMLDGETEGEVKVLETVDGSAAQKSGLQKGDVLKTVNGQKVTSHQSLVTALEGKKVDDTVEIAYEREGKTMVTNAVLTAYKGEMKMMNMESDGTDDENIWIEEEGGKVIELEDGKKMIFIEKEGNKTTTTKKVIKKNGKTKKTIKVEVETEGTEKEEE